MKLALCVFNKFCYHVAKVLNFRHMLQEGHKLYFPLVKTLFYP